MTRAENHRKIFIVILSENHENCMADLKQQNSSRRDLIHHFMIFTENNNKNFTMIYCYSQ